VNLLLTRTFFSLQRPWLPTGIGAATLLVNLLVALALYKPFGVAGIVVATAVSSAAMTAGQAYYLRRELGGRLEGAATLRAVVRMLIAAAALAAVAYLLWRGLDAALGRSLPAQVVSVGGGLLAGIAVYTAVVLALRVTEAEQIRELVRARLRRSG
jgi:putative peptidoglycan lipid II flippase